MYLPVRTALAAGVALLIAAGTPALADIVNFRADLKGASEVPPNNSAGTGTVDANLDTNAKTLTWTITYSGLSGDATAAHFHGPADPGANAKPVVPIKGDLASPIRGDATLSDAQMKDLQDGKWYFNIHTAAHPDGEIRGQLAAR